MYIISACLVGENCKYNGGNNETRWIVELAERHRHILVCPEVSGGLPVPRAPVEIVEGRAINTEGVDVTAEFRRGCELEWRRIEKMKEECKETIAGAILNSILLLL